MLVQGRGAKPPNISPKSPKAPSLSTFWGRTSHDENSLTPGFTMPLAFSIRCWGDVSCLKMGYISKTCFNGVFLPVKIAPNRRRRNEFGRCGNAIKKDTTAMYAPLSPAATPIRGKQTLSWVILSCLVLAASGNGIANRKSPPPSSLDWKLAGLHGLTRTSN